MARSGGSNAAEVPSDIAVVVLWRRSRRRSIRSWGRRRFRARAYRAHRNRRGCLERDDLLLHAGRIPEWHRVESFAISRLVRRKDSTLHAARQRFDAILEHRTEQRRGREFEILV